MSIGIVFRILDHDTALAWQRVEPHPRVAAEQCLDKRVVHRAHQHRELSGQRVERAVNRRCAPSSSPASTSLSRWNAASVRVTPAASAASARPTSCPASATYSYRSRRTGSASMAMTSTSCTGPLYRQTKHPIEPP